MRGPHRPTAMFPADADWAIAVGRDDEWDALSPMVTPSRSPDGSFHAPRRAVMLIALAGIVGVVIGMTLGSSAHSRDECTNEYSPIDCSE